VLLDPLLALEMYPVFHPLLVSLMCACGAVAACIIKTDVIGELNNTKPVRALLRCVYIVQVYICSTTSVGLVLM
jgi:hypothetical protein